MEIKNGNRITPWRGGRDVTERIVELSSSEVLEAIREFIVSRSNVPPEAFYDESRYGTHLQTFTMSDDSDYEQDIYVSGAKFTYRTDTPEPPPVVKEETDGTEPTEV